MGALLVGFVGARAAAAFAANSTWEGGRDDDWDDDRNWSGNEPGSGDTAIFGPSAQRFQINLRGNQDIRKLQFSPSNGNPPWDFTGGSLTPDSGGEVSWSQSNDGTTIAVDIVNLKLTEGPTVWTGDNLGTTLVLSGSVTGDQDWILGDSAILSASLDVLALDDANTYSGDFTIHRGVLRIAHRSALQNAAVIGGQYGAIESTGDATLRMVSGSADFAIGGSAQQVVTVGEGHTGTATCGAFSGAGGLVKTGAGTRSCPGTIPIPEPPR